MEICILKSHRRLELWDGDALVLACRVALGSSPAGAKRRRGDGRTPEGRYHICLVKENGKYGRSLGIDYPSVADAELALHEGRIDEGTFLAIQKAHEEHRRPPWGSPLGGEIYLHEGGTASDWTAGCVALDAPDMDRLYPLWQQIREIRIEP